jgi:hypothetical protein
MDLNLLKDLSSKGDLHARFHLALHYYYSDDETQDFEEAARLFKELAEGGNSDAQYLLGEMYEYGFGVEQDISEAVKLYILSAEAGNPSGQSALGNSYDSTVGSPEGTAYGGIIKNNREAYFWYLLALQSNPDEPLLSFLNEAIKRLSLILTKDETSEIKERVSARRCLEK